MIDYLKIFGALIVLAIIGAIATYVLPLPEVSRQNVTFIQKTNPHWPAKGEISVDPCRYRNCTDV